MSDRDLPADPSDQPEAVGPASPDDDLEVILESARRLGVEMDET